MRPESRPEPTTRRPSPKTSRVTTTVATTTTPPRTTVTKTTRISTTTKTTTTSTSLPESSSTTRSTPGSSPRTKTTSTMPWWMSTAETTARKTSQSTQSKMKAGTTPWWVSSSTGSSPSSSTSTRAATTPWWMSTASSPTRTITAQATTSSSTPPAKPSSTTPWWMSTATTRGVQAQPETSPTAIPSSSTSRSAPTTAPWTVPWWMTTPSTTQAPSSSSESWTRPWWMTTTQKIPSTPSRTPSSSATSTTTQPSSSESWTRPWWMTTTQATPPTTAPTSESWTRPWWMTTTQAKPSRSRSTSSSSPSTMSTTTTARTRPTSSPTTSTTRTAPKITTTAYRPPPPPAPSPAPAQVTAATAGQPVEPYTTSTPSTTRVYITTTSAPDRWRAAEVTLPTETTQRPSTHQPGPSTSTTSSPSTTPEAVMHREPLEKKPPPKLPPTEFQTQTEPSTEIKEEPQPTGDEEEEEETGQEQEPRIVTSRPIHVVQLEESEESTTQTTQRGTTMGIRVTTPSGSIMSGAPHTAIFNESTFSTEAQPSITTATSLTYTSPMSTSTEPEISTQTTSTRSYPNQPTRPQEEPEEPKEGEETTWVPPGQLESSETSSSPARPPSFPPPNLSENATPQAMQPQTSSRPGAVHPTSTAVRPQMTSTTASEPFNARPDMFEEDTRPTAAHREPVTTNETTEQMTTSASTVEVQPPPDTVFMPRGVCPIPNDPTDRSRSDVLFLLDSSNSFNEQKFMHAIQLILDTVAHFKNIGPNGTQVSLVQYNSEPYLEFSLRKHNCKQWLIEDIADTDYMQGGSMLGKALEKVSKFAFTKNRGDRPDAENVLVILTDGRSDDRIQEPVEIAKKNNLTVLVIATLEASREYLVELAGDMDNVFQLRHDIKNSLPKKIAQRINSIATESPTTETFKVKDGHEMFTIALPTEQEEQRPRPWQVPDNWDTATPTAAVPTISSPPFEATDVNGMVHLHCSPLGFKIGINAPPGFTGVAVVKGQEDKEECRKDIDVPNNAADHSASFFVATKSCGVTSMVSIEPAGHNYTLILHLKHRNGLVTRADRAYLLQCFIGKPLEDQELTADLGVMKGELMIAETISLLSVPPTCAYSIRKDSPNGTIVKNAFVGETVYHRWECDGGEESNNVYGIQVHSCYASDDVDKKYPIVDSRGCSSDLALLSDPKYREDSLTAYAQSTAFAFQDAEQLKFVCKLSLCTRDGDGCEGVTPPACGGNSPELLATRRIRQQVSAMEGALSSALSTRVGVASSTPAAMQERVVEMLSSNGMWILLVLMVIVAMIGTVVLTRYAMSSTDATTTCSDPDTIISPPMSPLPPTRPSPVSSPIPLMDSPPPPMDQLTDVPAPPRPPVVVPTCSTEQSTAQSTSTSITLTPQEERNRRLATFMADFDRSRYV
ncbi:hypothetical protein Q1695_013817 [Nippostrongylus brasiliensis]|nr:hypothetical protein Q1695_013817 [Nippostrongylus brasiliensis]